MPVHNFNRFEVVSKILTELSLLVAPGVTGKQIEKAAEELIKTYGYKSYNKGYAPKGHQPFPSVICISIDQMIAHGIPIEAPFMEGDLVNLDIGIIDPEGMAADAALTVPVLPIENKHERLLRVAKQTLYAGIDAVHAGATVRDVARTIQNYASQRGYVVNKNFCGHGIGKKMHEPPQMYHTVENNTHFDYDYILKEGEIICLEPMLTFTDPLGILAGDGWTWVTNDGKYSAMFEHMIRVEKDGATVLTTHISR